MNNRLNMTGMPIGGTSLLMSFILLCITVCASITYISSVRDYNLSKKAAENITIYYKAENKAEEILSEISQQLISQENIYDIPNKYLDNNMVIMKSENQIIASYSVNIKEDMVLDVRITFEDEQSTIDCWKIKNNRTIEDNPQFLDLLLF